ncbi:hypothetical protein [Legionella drancourtii]|uniref:Uncharacterized protein n=1 Tax=Legionella drancourtii LLAP12 TaxID=658187 RepID=G9EKA0_9GAMM|nr:hypothetical protein [Legionella drancourtii]EHL32251.1 hypothetical protein LDG_5624 [Legionella drancourtii LLAP12]
MIIPLVKICSALSISRVQIREKLLPKEDVAIQFVEVKKKLLPLVTMPFCEQDDVCASALNSSLILSWEFITGLLKISYLCNNAMRKNKMGFIPLH